MKVCLLGDGSVGKTALRERFIGRAFRPNYLMTIGADFTLRRIMVGQDEYKVQIWDLAGQMGFKDVRKLYYKGSDGFLIVFDLTRLPSYENVVNWVDEGFKHLERKPIPIVLVGNKLDLRQAEDGSHVSNEAGRKLAEHIREKYLDENTPVQYIETSAKTAENVDAAFTLLAKFVADSAGE